MIRGRDPANAFHNAAMALEMFCKAPAHFGGICLRGGGPARDALIERFKQSMPTEALHRLPPRIDDEQLLGGVDVAASLAAARTVTRGGFLKRAAGGIILVPMAERVSAEIAGRLAQAMDNASGDERFALVLLDDGIEAEERPPSSLLERIAFHCDLREVRSLELPAKSSAMFGAPVEATPDDACHLAEIARALGISSVRPLIFAERAACAHAAMQGRSQIETDDLALAARLVLAPRATQLPPDPEPEPEPQEPPPPEDQSSDSAEDDSQTPDPEDLQELLLDAVAASIPPDLLDQLREGKALRSASGHGSGKKRKSKARGKPLAARPGMPDGGARLALIDTLRAAVPWQAVRRKEAGSGTANAILVRKDDLRVRLFEERSATVTIFAVDASGSAALARLAEAKGAVELMLAQAYVTRSEVALIAFRGDSAETLLPPTRSLTRAKKALSSLPGGGGTPLALGINETLALAERIRSQGSTPFCVFLTDGRANIDENGSSGREKAQKDAKKAAKLVAFAAFDALVIDISPRPSADARTLSEEMQARFITLPMADAKALHKAVEQARPAPQTA